MKNFLTEMILQYLGFRKAPVILGAPCSNNISCTWASDKCCRTCIHYDGRYCMIDDRQYGENYYCSSWRP